MSEGLSHNSVLCLIQDQEGYIWVGTRDGLNRFDGHTFTHFNKRFGDSTSLSNNYISCLYESSNGDLWIGTANGINWLKKGETQFRQFLIREQENERTSNYIRTITESESGLIIAGTSMGIVVLDPSTEQITRHFLPEQSMVSQSVVRIYHDYDSLFWVGTRNGLYHWDMHSFKRILIDESIEDQETIFEIRDIKKVSAGTYFLATEHHGVYKYRYVNGEETVEHHYHTANSGLHSNTVRVITVADDDQTWLGTFDGLSLYDTIANQFDKVSINLGSHPKLNNYSIRDIFFDNQDGLWVATYAGGLLYYHPDNHLFAHYMIKVDAEDRTSANVVARMLEYDDRQLWIGTEGGGLFRADIMTGWTKNYVSADNDVSLAGNNIKAMVADKHGNLWLGTNHGLSFFDPRTEKFITYRHDYNDPESLIFNQVYALYIDEEDVLWIGTNGGGVQLFNTLTGTFSRFDDLTMSNVNVMIESSDGLLWVGTQTGLECVNLLTGKAVDVQWVGSSVPIDIRNVHCLYEDKSGVIWAGTLGYGLLAIAHDKVYWFSNQNGLPDNTVNSILQDDNGYYWITTNRGLSRLQFRREEGVFEIESCMSFSVSQGLQGQQFYPMSTLKSSIGAFILGGNYGINVFYPDEILEKSFFPNVTINDLTVLSGKRSDGPQKASDSANLIDQIKLSYQQRNITVGFSGINFISPEKTVYRYQLINHHSDWVYIGNQRSINFNFLPSGKYELRIQASTMEDRWGDEYKSIMITVLPPWWVATWAFMAYFIIISSLLFVFFLYSQRWARLKNELVMEHFQREKENELHRSKVRFFTDISHELRTPLTLILSPIERIIHQPDLTSKLRSQLIMVQRNGKRMMHLVNKVLDLRRLESGHEKLAAVEGDLVAFLNEVSLAFEEAARIQSIDFLFQPKLSGLDVYFDRDKLEIILYNLLSNSFKNTEGGGLINLEVDKVHQDQLPSDVKACMTHSKEYAHILVSDNGKGIPAEIMENIFNRFFRADLQKETPSMSSGIGLELARRMVELHKGTITVQSDPGSENTERCTCFSVFLPLGRSHLSESDLFASSTTAADHRKQPLRFTVSEYEKEQIGMDAETFQESNHNATDKELPLVLVIDDHDEIRGFIRSLFEGEYNVIQASDGDEGVSLALEEIPDLIICDVMMPTMSGIEFCKCVKNDIRTSHIPVILLTAQTDMELKYEGLETGADDHITKPFSPDYLLAKCKNLMRQRNRIRQHFQQQAIVNPSQAPVASLDGKLLQKAVDYIIENMSDPALGVQAISNEIGLSRVHFYRKIKALTNCTAVEFVRMIRLKRAAWLIEQNNLNIKEIRSLVGIEDAGYFRECFVNQYGVTPSDYAKKFQKGQGTQPIVFPEDR